MGERSGMPSPEANGVAHKGPYVVLDLEEKNYLAQTLDCDHPVGKRIHEKVVVALGTDPKLLRPV